MPEYAINPGDLRHRVTVEAPPDPARPTITPSGQLSNVYTTLYTGLPACITHLQGRELMVAQQLNAEVTTRISMRWVPGLTTLNRVRWYDPAEAVTWVFDVVDTEDPDMRHRWLHLLCKSGVRVD